MSMTKRMGVLLVAAAAGSLGCSDPVPPASEGAFSLVFQQLGTGGQNCRIGLHNISMGKADEAEVKDLIKDTIGGAQIFCSVVDKGGAFDVFGFMTLGVTHLDFQVDNVSSGATDVDPAVGTLSYASADTAGATYSSAPGNGCHFYFNAAQQQELAAGKAWMSFGCPQVQDPGVGSSCAIADHSTIAIQNCDK